MGFTATLAQPFFEGSSGSTSVVPGLYDVAIDSHPYMIDTTFEFGRRDSFRHSSIPAQRTAVQVSNISGEESVNTQGLWRREAPDWSLGAGQLFGDRDGSFPNRFFKSKGVDPFTQQWYVSLLKSTQLVSASSDPQLQVLVVGQYCYKLTSTTLQFSTNLTSWTTVSGLPSSGLVMMAGNGNNLWIACGTNLLYQTTAGVSTATQLVTSGVSGAGIYFVAFCSNVLFVAQGASIYQITSSSPAALPTALMTQNNPTWTWTAACGGYGWIYLAGFSGNFSAIYATANLSDGTGLSAPTISGPLPPGEICYALFAFVNFVFVGTSAGARFCITLGPDDAGGSPGDLKMGAIIPNLLQPVTSPVKCFTAQNRFVWFGWSNYDTTSTGLGRVDISQYTGTQTPAYCSDLMASTQGQVTSCDYFNGAPIFVVNGVGVYTEATTYVESGSIVSPFIGFGIPDHKVLVALSVDVVEPINGSITAAISADDGSLIPLGTSTTDPPGIFAIPQLRGELYRTTISLNAGNSNMSTPTVRRATLQGIPTITAGIQLIAALRLFFSVEIHGGGTRIVDVPAEIEFLENLRASQQVVTYQEGSLSYEVTVAEIDIVFYERSKSPLGFFNAIAVITMQTLGGILN